MLSVSYLPGHRVNHAYTIASFLHVYQLGFCNGIDSVSVKMQHSWIIEHMMCGWEKSAPAHDSVKLTQRSTMVDVTHLDVCVP